MRQESTTKAALRMLAIFMGFTLYDLFKHDYYAS